MIMVALDRKETAGRLVELLDFPRPEVFVAAAWGLRRLAVPFDLPGDPAEGETNSHRAVFAPGKRGRRSPVPSFGRGPGADAFRGRDGPAA